MVDRLRQVQIETITSFANGDKRFFPITDATPPVFREARRRAEKGRPMGAEEIGKFMDGDSHNSPEGNGRVMLPLLRRQNV